MVGYKKAHYYRPIMIFASTMSHGYIPDQGRPWDYGDCKRIALCWAESSLNKLILGKILNPGFTQLIICMQFARDPADYIK